jgi:hypothetical protein
MAAGATEFAGKVKYFMDALDVLLQACEGVGDKESARDRVCKAYRDLINWLQTGEAPMGTSEALELAFLTKLTALRAWLKKCCDETLPADDEITTLLQPSTSSLTQANLRPATTTVSTQLDTSQYADFDASRAKVINRPGRDSALTAASTARVVKGVNQPQLLRPILNTSLRSTLK